jgi:hypothetical protein
MALHTVGRPLVSILPFIGYGPHAHAHSRALQFLHQMTAIVPLLLLAPHDVREGAYYVDNCEGARPPHTPAPVALCPSHNERSRPRSTGCTTR